MWRVPVWRTPVLWAGLIFAAAAAAQTTTTAIVLTFSSANLSGDILNGSGTVDPFGSAEMSFEINGQGGSNASFTFSDGDTLTASATNFKGGVNGGSGVASITGGTGLFKGATGSFSFTFQLVATQDNATFQFAGNGTAVLQTASAGPGGSGYPTAGPGGPGYPGDTLGGEQIVVCQAPATGTNSGPRSDAATGALPHPEGLYIAPADCSTAKPSPSSSSGSSSGTEYFPIYDTQDPNNPTQLSFFITAQQLSAAEDLQADLRQLQMSMVRKIGSQLVCHGCNAAAATASSLAASAYLVTPIQSAAATYTATPSCPSSPNNCWISAPNPTGSIAANSRAAITAIIDPTNLTTPGVYSGNVAVALSPSGNVLTTPVTVTVNTASAILSVSQTGLQFEAAAGSTVAQSQTVAVSATGTGSWSFSTSASTLTGGNWLTVSPNTLGPTNVFGPQNVSVSVNPSGLPAGQYYGLATITSSGSVNSPQSVEVVLTVKPASAGGPLITPAGLSFTAPATGNPASQTIQFINLTNQTLTVSASADFGAATGWFSVTSSSNSVAAGQTLTESVAVNTAGLSAGSYLGNLDLHVPQLNTDYFVPVLLVVPISSQLLGGTASRLAASAAVVCAPSQLLPVFTNLTGGFTATAGLPVSVQVTVSDDCGNPLNAGGVELYFPGSGDENISMTSLGNGQWVATWMPHNAQGGDAEIGVIATEASPALAGSAGVAGTVVANSATPIISPGGVVSAASVASGGPLPVAPGEFISIFGQNFAPAGQSNPSAQPYQTLLAHAQVTLGGELLPLQVTATGQINGVVPYDAAAGSSQQLIVELNSSAYSMPEPVLIASAQPSIFTQDQSGSGPGAILTAKADGTVTLNTASAPASANDVLEVYCTGLGAVSPAVPAGVPAPNSTLSYTTNTVTATLGGVPATVGFSGLAPGYAGLYQVNVTVPSGVKPGPNVPLVLFEAGAVSPPVTVAIQ